MDLIFYFVVGIVILTVLSFVLKLSFRLIVKLLMNAVVGGIIILLINFFGGSIGISIDLNIFSALIVGIFGILGVIILLIVGW